MSVLTCLVSVNSVLFKIRPNVRAELSYVRALFPFRKIFNIEFFIYVWKQCLFCCNSASHFRSGLGLTWARLQSRFRSRIRSSRSNPTSILISISMKLSQPNKITSFIAKKQAENYKVKMICMGMNRKLIWRANNSMLLLQLFGNLIEVVWRVCAMWGKITLYWQPEQQ